MTVSNNEIKKIRSLSQKKFRDSLGLFVVEGEKMVEEASRSGFEIESIYWKSEIGEVAMSKITQLSTPSPVLAVVRKPKDAYLSELSSYEDAFRKGGLYLGLDQIRDPGNLGTILRVADWFGIKTVFAEEGTVDLFNPKTVQATMGAIFRVKLHYVDLKSVAETIIQHSGDVYGTFLEGENIYKTELNHGKNKPSLIVIGNESDGISEGMSKFTTQKIHIPAYPSDSDGSESLNAAIATAITVAEFRRHELSELY